MHIAVLMTNTDTSDFAAVRPRDGEKFATMIHSVRPDWQVTVFDVTMDQFPADNARFDGWLIGGSPASVNDNLPWIARLFTLIRRLAAEGQPLFGTCFGHQAIAAALGGKVGPNPGGWVFGTVATEIEGHPIHLYASHSEQVLTLPKGAKPLGGTPDCPFASYAIENRVMTTQYHPEMTHAFISDLVEEYADKLPKTVTITARGSLKTRANSREIATRIAEFFESAA